VLFDLTSSYLRRHLSAVQNGYAPRRQRGTLQVTRAHDRCAGCPLSVSVYAGNTPIPDAALHRWRRRGRRSATTGGDGGRPRHELQRPGRGHAPLPAVDGITAQKSGAIASWPKRALQLDLYDRATSSPSRTGLSGRALIACRTRRWPRSSREAPDLIAKPHDARAWKAVRLRGGGPAQGCRPHRCGRKVANKVQGGKALAIAPSAGHAHLRGRRGERGRASALDGHSVLRIAASEAAALDQERRCSAKGSGEVERAFARLKGVDLPVRPTANGTRRACAPILPQHLAVRAST